MRLNIRLLAAVKQNFFITTPIFYVNAAPHIGHLYTALVADAVQRFEKLVHPDINVVFTTGTDEHGTKIQQAAAKANLPLPEYCTKISQEYKDLFKEYNIGYTDFVRTTEDRHKTAVRHFWNKLKEDDYIYKASYSGWYSVNDEAFVPDTHVKDQNRDGEMVKVSLESGHTVEWTEETNYMFRLSAFKTHLQRWLKTDGLITPHKFQKQLQDMVAGDAYLPDISVSRPSSRVHWAIRVPDDDTQSIYVWLDALVNYLTVGGYPRPHAPLHPPDLHVLGKDILKFHGIYWPAFLMAIKWHPPRAILCHGHWTVDGAKMSKSLHNVVSPRDSEVGSEGLRYFLLSEHTLHSDANYSTTKLINTVNASLADTLGNLVSRCSGPALNPRGELPPPPPAAPAPARPLIDAVTALPEKCHHFYSNYQFYKAVDSVIEVLHMANLYFEEQKPWELRKRIECQKDLDDILHITMETLRVCGIILQPIIPELSTKLLDKLSVPKDERTWEHCEKMSWLETGAIREMRHIQSGKFVLFQRVYTDKDKKTAKEKKANV